MSSKFENTLAQLYKLKNQMRIELNQIRPFKDYGLRHQNKDKKSQKRCFLNNYQQSSIVCSLISKENQYKPQRKRQIQSQTIPHIQFQRSFQKKHFDKHYKDSVKTQMTIKKTKSSYLNIKSQRNQSSQQIGYGNSLLGLGSRTENMQKSRSSIRVYRVEYVHAIGQGGSHRKSLLN